ncbi:MAG: hypothetical protein F4Y82_06515 [Cenarchaeum sp. SB0665_bin_23]|nr:hypothetical protein [Cenarchaeum sp. SB0667_bin_13]MXY37948.1 hypothetical protein [Cenarchaeum sp. SB0664_bin_35]MXY61743.1 hypothetical protein [Cenarchaeum sp. SB0665_bin_23]MXZ94107.1 hypothetical protein [Cenarchaeum sp. SB0666_bin_15]MYB47091.1 hypothetical protein [Cenarchaeum sp. SB0662_bin_33]MYC79629.1 hypothetical protein [Cenarchaeum sp. SB0661_bin_35]MYD58698.1 hypothetical protein [Cenarchaeum sp. SB0678_bin_8]MYG32662.1 hypothetical protein [Cenarchaeum sp. SB0677_bin_16]
MFRILNDRIAQLQRNLQPDILAHWHKQVIHDARDMAPPWLQDKISVIQDPYLPMKFNLDISKRAVSYYMMALHQNLPNMPLSTQLYFLKVYECLNDEIDRQLV